GGHRGRARAGDRGEEERGDDRHRGQTVAEPAEDEEGEVDEPLRNARVLHHDAGKDEERNRQQRARTHRREHDRRHHAEDLHTVRGGLVEDGRQAEREGDGDPYAEEEEEAAEEQKRAHFRPPWNSSASMAGAASLASLRVTSSAELSSCREVR